MCDCLERVCLCVCVFVCLFLASVCVFVKVYEGKKGSCKKVC